MVSTTIKISENAMSELRSIATTERRSVGFLIRDAITFWLTEHARQEAERTDNMQPVPWPGPISERPIRVENAALKIDSPEGKK